ncbi:MAG TPA: Phenylacetic acid catabolic protein [Azospirillum sp.]|nr:Phenylacetic acid catabolic protein [Azospirillum sp.]
MFRNEADLVAHIAAGGTIPVTADLPAGYRAELLRLMAGFADSELAGAAGLADMINRAPGLRERRTAARIVSEKYGHAETVLGLMQRFGVNPQLYVRSHCWTARFDRHMDFGNRRIGTDKRLNVFHYPVEGWVDVLVLTLLMGYAAAPQLGELAACSYEPLAAAMAEVAEREAVHVQLAGKALEQGLAEMDCAAAARASVAYWYPRVVDTFGRIDSERVDLYRRFGLRRHSNAELLRQWDATVRPHLDALGLPAPV